MRFTAARRVVATLSVVAFALAASVASADVDVFGYGDGHAGALLVNAPGTIVNEYAALGGDVASGAVSLAVASTSAFAAGDLVLVVQLTGLTPAPVSGSTAPVDLEGSAVGTWELARVSTVTTTALNLTNPMRGAFASASSEIVRVPEFTSVDVAASGGIVAQAWNGTTGGVVAFLARGVVTNLGSISADGAGFAGGAFVASPSVQLGCSALDQGAPGGGNKGAGIGGGPATGRGDLANGGGGADCYRSGGGGGALAGAGGAGGFSDASDGSRAVGGMGGAPLLYSTLSQLVPGGGGGAGQGSAGDGTAGGNGGGVLFVRAQSLAGTGVLSARGDDASTAGDDGGGGGGAGGTVYVRVAGSATCGGIDARGGNGASLSSPAHGPGGGGGGGQVLLQAASTSCPVTVSAGVAGTMSDGTGNGASAGGPGNVQQPPPGAYCAGNSDCLGATPVCDVIAGVCVGCLVTTDCTNPAAPVCAPDGPFANTCVECTAGSASLCSGTKPACLAVTDTCGCSASDQCPTANPTCETATSTCAAQCSSDSDCATPPLSHCDVSAAPHACVACIGDTDCPAGLICSSLRTCVQCTSADETACTFGGAGAACLADGRCGCESDADCGGAAAGRICDATTEQCIAGCDGEAETGPCAPPPVDDGGFAADDTSDGGEGGDLGGTGLGCALSHESGQRSAGGDLALLIGALIVACRRVKRGQRR